MSLSVFSIRVHNYYFIIFQIAICPAIILFQLHFNNSFGLDVFIILLFLKLLKGLFCVTDTVGVIQVVSNSFNTSIYQIIELRSCSILSQLFGNFARFLVIFIICSCVMLIFV